MNFLITVDTEGDNLWDWHEGEPLTTENCRFIPRFQELCETYGFITTWLVTYEMAQEERCVSYLKRKRYEGKCEIGLHIHAWNSPPLYPLPKIYKGKPFITEYPRKVAFEKMRFLKELLEDRFECGINVSRSGRFGTDETFFEILSELGIGIDCSVTPQIDHSGTEGRTIPHCNNYMDAGIRPYWINKDVLEIPLTSRKRLYEEEGGAPYVWMRAAGMTAEGLLHLADQVEAEGVDNVEFMIHSSELMPGGSPYYRTAEEIENLYKLLNRLFIGLRERGYTGSSLTEYGKIVRN